MASPHNIKAGMQRAGRADVAKVKDPGDGNSIDPSNYDFAFCIVTGGTTRGLASASRFPVSTRVLVISQTSSITVNSNVVLGDGDYAEFTVGLDASGAKEWQRSSGSTYTLTTETIPATPTNQQIVDALLSLVTDLENAGIVDATGFTQA